jgi:hypothetical protein
VAAGMQEREERCGPSSVASGAVRHSTATSMSLPGPASPRARLP